MQRLDSHVVDELVVLWVQHAIVGDDCLPAGNDLLSLASGNMTPVAKQPGNFGGIQVQVERDNGPARRAPTAA